MRSIHVFVLAFFVVVSVACVLACGVGFCEDASLPELTWSGYLGGEGGEAGYAAAAREGFIAICGPGNSESFPYDAYDHDTFVAKVDASGRFLWAVDAGGRAVTGVAFDVEGNVLVAGTSKDDNAFVRKVSPSGVILWTCNLGGNLNDVGRAVACDAEGNAWVTGWTASTTFPTPGGFDTTYNGDIGLASDDAFVAKVSPDGDLLWASYLGGQGRDRGRGIAIDGQGNVIICGYTWSPDFPLAGRVALGADVFVAKLSAGGSLLWTRVLTGRNRDYGHAVAADTDGNIYITGMTTSPDFPLSHAFQPTVPVHTGAAFVTKLSPSGTILWSSYLGGSGTDNGYAIAVDDAGEVFITGDTGSSDFPTVNAFDMDYDGGFTDAFVARVTSSGRLAWSSYLGGKGQDIGRGVCVIGSGKLVVVGATNSSDFPAYGGLDGIYNGNWDAFVSVIRYLQDRQWTLTVQSTPITGVIITGDAPGTTNHTTTFDDQEVVNLTAPPTVTVESVRYNFVRWEGYLDGQIAIEITMDADRAVAAVYVAAPQRLIIEGPDQRGEEPALMGVGTFTVDVYAEGIAGFAAVQAVLEFADPSGAEDAFRISMLDGNPEFGGQAIVYNEALFGSIFPIYVGVVGRPFYRQTAGFMLMSGNADLPDKTWLTSITYDYDVDFDAVGTHTIVANELLTIIAGDGIGIPHEVVPGSVTFLKWPIPADANFDCIVNIIDMLVIRDRLNADVNSGDNWRADVNEDGAIDVLDLIFVRNKLHDMCDGMASAPRPE